MTLPYSSKPTFFYDFFKYVMGVFMFIDITLSRCGRADSVYYAAV